MAGVAAQYTGVPLGVASPRCMHLPGECRICPHLPLLKDKKAAGLWVRALIGWLPSSKSLHIRLATAASSPVFALRALGFLEVAYLSRLMPQFVAEPWMGDAEGYTCVLSSYSGHRSLGPV